MGINNTNMNLFFLSSEIEKYWIFKIEDYRKNFLIDIILDKNTEYTFEYEVNTIQKTDFYGKVLFLFLNEVSKEWTIEYEGNVKNFEYSKSEEKETDVTNDKKKYFKITFNNIFPLQEVKLLDDLKYSIKLIKDFDYPINGLRNNLNKISKIEYDAIVFGEIYYSRTVFYKLFNSLQSNHKLAFYLQIFNSSIDKARIENDYNKLLPILNKYIENNIYKSAKIFIESIDIFKKLNQNTDLSKIGFDNIENQNKRIDYILPNYEYSKEFIAYFEKFPPQEEIKNEYSDFKKTENEFYKIFKSIPFPLDLL